MQRFHALPKFGPERCPVIYITHGSVLFLPGLKSKENLPSNNDFPLWNHALFILHQRVSLCYQHGCTACFTEKQRDLSILMPMWQSVFRPFLPKAARQNYTFPNLSALALLPRNVYLFLRQCKFCTQSSTLSLASDSAIKLHLLQNPTRA